MVTSFKKGTSGALRKKGQIDKKTLGGASDPSASPCSAGTVQAYPELCPALVYAENWYTRNPGIFRTLS